MATANEKLLNGLIRHQIGLVRVSNNLRRRMVSLLQRTEQAMKDGIVARLTTLSGSSGAGFTLDPAARRKLQRIEDQIERNRSPGFKKLFDELSVDLQEIALEEPRFLKGLVMSVTQPLEPRLSTPSASELRKIVTSRPFQGRVLRDWAQTIETDERRRIMNEIRIGLTRGEDVDTITRRIVGSAALMGRDGITGRTRRDAQAIVRTSVNHISSAAAREFALANRNLIRKEIWVSILDGRTSDICLSLNGTLFDVGKGQYPPVHYNALAEGSLIETERGPIPIEHVRVGENVLTHRGRMQPVTTVMSKPCDVDSILRVETSSGNVVLATDEHPVLVMGRGWVRADQIEFGDKLFEHDKQETGLKRDACIVGHANDYPSPFDEPLVPYKVSFAPGSMASTVDLDSEHVPWKGEVDGAQGSAFVPMLGFDKMGEVRRVDHWRLSDVIAVTRLPYRSQVYNLSVGTDETYISDGIVVHNCRSRRAPLISNTEIVHQRIPADQRRVLLREFADREGIGRVSSVGQLTPRQRRRFEGFSRQWLREHVGGVPGVQSTEDFLASMSISDLSDLLGVTKARLVRRGGLTIGKLVDRHGRSLTLSELAAKERQAFERAGVDVSRL